MLETARHQECRGQQHQGHRHLDDHQRIAAPQAFAPGRIDVHRLQPVDEIRTRALQRRHQTARQRGDAGHDDAGEQHARVHAERDGDRQFGRNPEVAQERDAGVADGDAAQPSESCEHQAFGQQQPDQPEPAGAERQPQCNFARARAGAGEEKASDVGAGHEQHRDGEDREDHAELPVGIVVPRPHLELRVHRRAALAVELRILAGEILRQHRGFTARLLQRGARFEASLNAQLTVVAVLEEILLRVDRERARHRQRDVEIGTAEDAQAGERVRQDANDGEVRAVQPNRPADDGGVAREFVLPEGRREHRHRLAARHLIFVVAKTAAQLRFHAEHAEVVAGHHQPRLDPRRVSGSGAETHGSCGGPVRDHAVVAGRLAADVQIFAIREIVEGVVA